MGSGCDSVIEYRFGKEPWKVWPEEEGDAAIYNEKWEPVYIPRGWGLYVLLGVFEEEGVARFEGSTDEKAMFPKRGPPKAMSDELEKHLYHWADGDAKKRMSWLSVDELRAASAEWDSILTKDDCDPADPECVSLRPRLFVAERLADEMKVEVRMIYWFSS